MRRVELVLFCHKRMVKLGKAEGDETDAPKYPEGDLGVDRVYYHDKQNDEHVEDGDSKPIGHLQDFILHGHPGLEVDAWEQEEESGREDGADDQVDVKSPTPGSATVSKGATDLNNNGLMRTTGPSTVPTPQTKPVDPM
ncbi:MAG: hypothetical protein Q9198_004246 [Flavoplaca austrocitrina]